MSTSAFLCTRGEIVRSCNKVVVRGGGGGALEKGRADNAKVPPAALALDESFVLLVLE